MIYGPASLTAYMSHHAVHSALDPTWKDQRKLKLSLINCSCAFGWIILGCGWKKSSPNTYFC